MGKEKIIGVQWKAKSYLADVEFLDRDVECTYFRLCNYIYLTQDQLRDDDEKLWSRCKCKSIREYRRHKAELMKPRGIDPATGKQIPPRITIEVGSEVGVDVGSDVPFIRSEKCTEQLGFSSRFRKQKSDAGKASAEARSKDTKRLENKDTVSTVVSTETSTEQPTAEQRQAQRSDNEASNGSLNGGSSNLQPSTLKESSSSYGDAVQRIASELWEHAGRQAEADRKHVAGNVDDWRHVRRWLATDGFTEAEILAAGKQAIDSAGELTNLWGYLAKAMPDRVATLRKSTGERASEWTAELQRKAALIYFGVEVGGVWKAKAKANRSWAFGFAKPFQAGCQVADDIAADACRQLGLDPDAERMAANPARAEAAE